jgi:hypothetical protein
MLSYLKDTLWNIYTGQIWVRKYDVKILPTFGFVVKPCIYKLFCSGHIYIEDNNRTTYLFYLN